MPSFPSELVLDGSRPAKNCVVHKQKLKNTSLKKMQCFFYWLGQKGEVSIHQQMKYLSFKLPKQSLHSIKQHTDLKRASSSAQV